MTTVLVADDSETILLLMRTRLELAGYDVETAADGQEVTDLVDPSSDDGPDLLLLDAMMPRKSGIDALRELRAAGARDPGPDRQRPPGPERRRRAHRPRDQRLPDQADRLRPAARRGRRTDRRKRPDPARARQLLAAGDLEADLLAFELGAVEELDRALGLIGVDLDEGEAVQDADVVDGLVGQDGALAERPAQVVLVDPAALAAVDEELVVAGLSPSSGRRRARRAAPSASCAVAGSPRRRRPSSRLLASSRLLRRRAFAAAARLARGALAAARARRVLEPLLGALPLADRRLRRRARCGRSRRAPRASRR